MIRSSIDSGVGPSPRKNRSLSEKRLMPLILCLQTNGANDGENFLFRATCPNQWFSKDEVRILRGFCGLEKETVATIVITSPNGNDLERTILFSDTESGFVLTASFGFESDGAVNVQISKHLLPFVRPLSLREKRARAVLPRVRMEHASGTPEEVFQKHITRAPDRRRLPSLRKMFEVYEAILDYAPFL